MPKIEAAPPDGNRLGRQTFEIHGGLTVVQSSDYRLFLLIHTKDIRGFLGNHVNEKRLKQLLKPGQQIWFTPDDHGILHVITRNTDGSRIIQPISLGDRAHISNTQRLVRVAIVKP